jgi:uncharacterized protein (TIGR03435 family)
MRKLTLASLTFCIPLWPQTALPQFEAAEIKPVKPPAGARVSGDFQHGRLFVHNATLHMLVNSAYGTRFDHITGGPGWMDSDLFDIAAKADPATTEAESRLMLRALLEERFHLVSHHEQKTVAAFELHLAKGGPKFELTPEGSTDRQGCYGTPPACHRFTLSDLAGMLPNMAPNDIDRPVVDATGLSGRYDIPFPRGGRFVFESLAAAGLALEARKTEIDFLVIDRADRIPE